MFKRSVYIARRQKLREQIGTGLILMPGNGDSPINYPARTYRFRQDSSFLYFFGLDTPNLAAVIDIDENREVVFGTDPDIDHIVWMGDRTPIAEMAAQAGVKESLPLSRLSDVVRRAVDTKRSIHYLPPYRPEVRTMLSELIGIPPLKLGSSVSETFIRAVVAQREVKSPAEVAEIEEALRITREMHLTVMRMATPGVREREIAGRIEGIPGMMGGYPSAFTILTVHGEVLHGQSYQNILEDGQMLLTDAGSESANHYAGDITRTIPVNGHFTARQKEIYELVLKAQKYAIDAIKPGVYYKDVHLGTARLFAEGLIEIGLMKGNVDDAVAVGAHALFFTHGIGHMLGLDTHDMEGIGEDYVGYDETVSRSKQFGLSTLRLAKRVKPGFIFTIEPGIYFVPKLIGRWDSENLHADFVNYDAVERYRDFGGIRIENDVLVTEDGHQVLGEEIPRTVKDVEEAMRGRQYP
jgi:Xaa-Pro aminopeptidase